MLQAERIRAFAAKGDKDLARGVVQEIAHEFAGQGDARLMIQTFQRMADSAISCAENDPAGYIKAMANEPTFESAFLEGKFEGAERLASKGKNENALIHRGLLYLGLLKAGNKQAADEQWQPFLDALQKEGRRGRECAEMLAGKRPVDMEHLRRLAMEPQNKRVVLAVIAKRFPEHSKDLMTLARKLDYQRDPTSLCLRKVLE
jgi:hypothetical protein